MQNATWWRVGAVMVMSALVVAAVLTAPTLLLSGNARWWGLVGGLVVGVALVVGLSRSVKKAALSGRGTRTSLRGVGGGTFDVRSTPYPDGFDAERWMHRQRRHFALLKRVIPALYVGGLGGGVGAGVALDSAAASVVLGAVGLLGGGALGMCWAMWPWLRLRRLSSG